MSDQNSPPNAGGPFDESVVGVRLNITHTVTLDVYEHLDTVAREEGTTIDDIYLRIVHPAILDHMAERLKAKVAQARVQAALDSPTKPGPKPKKKAEKPDKKDQEIPVAAARKEKAAASRPKTARKTTQPRGRKAGNGHAEAPAQKATPKKAAPKKAATPKKVAAKKAPMTKGARSARPKSRR